MTSLTAVVPTRDKPDALRATLACLVADHGAREDAIEIVVVDDGERIGADSAVRGMACDLSIRVVQGPRCGRAAARNAGAGEAEGTRLLFLDDDILTASGFLSAHLAANPLSFMHGPLREFPGARRWLQDQHDASDKETARSAAAIVSGTRPGTRLFRNSLQAATLAIGAGMAPVETHWLAAVGANLSLDRAYFVEAGGFDEGFGTRWGCEDLELGVRLIDAGRWPTIEPRAGAVHLTHSREGRWSEHDVNLRRFITKHDRPSVRALPELLGPRGSFERYLLRLSELSAIG